jgi:Low iron-inducible periplasmic protein
MISLNITGLAENGTIKVTGSDTAIAYTYDIETQNTNERTIQYFSVKADEKMRHNSLETNDYFVDFQKFFDYYGSFTYADDFIMAAFKGTETSFRNGNADFSAYDFEARAEAVEKGSQYMSIAMYVIRELEDAVDLCLEACTGDDCDPDVSLDEAVAFYTGSLEGTDGSGDGVLPYSLADKRCSDFKTCGDNGDATSGTSKVNVEIFKSFSLMKANLGLKACDAARANKENIVKHMIVPLIQGTIRYAVLTVAPDANDKDESEGASFAAAVLPWIHACSAGDATTIYNNMKTGQNGSAKLADVKKAFENTYSCLGITCADVGGYYDSGAGSYYTDASPCSGNGSSSATSVSVGVASILSVVAFVVSMVI